MGRETSRLSLDSIRLVPHPPRTRRHRRRMLRTRGGQLQALLERSRQDSVTRPAHEAQAARGPWPLRVISGCPRPCNLVYASSGIATAATRAPTVRRSDVDVAQPAKSWGLADHPIPSGVKRRVRTLSAGSTTQSAHDHEIDAHHAHNAPRDACRERPRSRPPQDQAVFRGRGSDANRIDCDGPSRCSSACTIGFRANALNSRGIVGAGNPGRFAPTSWWRTQS
jgi:hypothetical protein